MASVTMASGQSASVPDGNIGRTAQNTPAVVQSRTDLLAPVLYFQSQSDVYAQPYGFLNYGPATQPDSAGFRLWEVAGTAHADACVVSTRLDDSGNTASAITRFNQMLDPPNTTLDSARCAQPINTGEEGYVLGAARQQLTHWVLTGGTRGGEPADAPPLFAGQQVGETASTMPSLDAHTP